MFNAVGVTSPVRQVTPPLRAEGPTRVHGDNSANGTKVPEILYLGAEFCPYCAAQRWCTIIALSRFGTWGDLGNMSSYAHDVYPNTPSFTFVKATYKSKYLVVQERRAVRELLDPKTNYYATLQKPTAQEIALVTKYDTPKYIKGLPANPPDPIPFMTFANKLLVSGASYSPA